MWDESGMQHFLRIFWEVPIAVGCLALCFQPGEEVPCSLPTMTHHWNPAAEGEGPVCIRNVIKRNFLLKCLWKDCSSSFSAALPWRRPGESWVLRGATSSSALGCDDLFFLFRP